MSNDDPKRFIAMANDYDAVAPYLVPKYDWFQDEMIRQSQVLNRPNPIVIDLGAGSGRLLEKLLERHPTMTGYWVDSSPGFTKVAKRRLKKHQDRVHFILSALEDPWEAQVPGPVDGIFSMSAIHHLETNEKQSLSRRCFKILKPGCWFLNTDEMKTLDEEAYRASLLYWVRHVDECPDWIPDERQEAFNRFRRHFAGWKQRNLDHFGEPKTKGDDLHESFIDQMTWLREAGLVDVDLFAKHHLWCLIGGRKPHTS